MNQDDLNPEARDAAMRFQTMVWSFMAPVRVVRVENDAEVEFFAGTGTLLNIDGNICVLTAWHVYEKAIRWRDEGAESFVLVQNAPLVPPIVLWKDESNDIVILAVPPEALPDIDAKPYAPSAGWPPRRVSTEDVVLACGFPVYLRSESDRGEILFGDFTLSQQVSGAYEHQFALLFDREKWLNLGRTPLPAPTDDLGSISGGPVFTVDAVPELVGIIKEIGVDIPLLYASSLAHVPARF